MSSQSELKKNIWENVERTNQNSVWKYFYKEKNSQLTMCKLCSKEIKCSGGSTSGMHTHMKTVHNETTTNKRKADSSETIIKSPVKITQYFTKIEDNSLEACVSRMVALDGFAYSKFVTSMDLRNLFLAKSFKTNLPKSANSIRKIVVISLILFYYGSFYNS